MGRLSCNDDCDDENDCGGWYSAGDRDTGERDDLCRSNDDDDDEPRWPPPSDDSDDGYVGADGARRSVLALVLWKETGGGCFCRRRAGPFVVRSSGRPWWGVWEWPWAW